VVEVPVDPAVAFGVLVRHCRINAGMTQKKAALLLEMDNIFSYQRLEKRCNATVEMLNKMLKLFPTLPLNEIFNWPSQENTRAMAKTRRHRFNKQKEISPSLKPRRARRG
jgi:DNA-binding XRE family transcriptional regulator